MPVYEFCIPKHGEKTAMLRVPNPRKIQYNTI